MIRTILYLTFLLPVFASAQLTIDVAVMFGNQPVALNQTVSTGNQSIQLEQVKFYLSKFEFYKNNQLVNSDSVSAYLIDLEIDSTMHLHFPKIQPETIDQVRFFMGIDSTTNTSGAMGGALDPMYGMYWSWQSGYINCKIEGSVLGAKKKNFQFHLGGYSGSFSALQTVVLDAKKSEHVLQIDLAPLLETALQSETETHVMSPCMKAVQYAQLIAQSIILTP